MPVWLLALLAAALAVIAFARALAISSRDDSVIARESFFAKHVDLADARSSWS